MKTHNIDVLIRVKGDSTIYCAPFKGLYLLRKENSKENLILRAKTYLNSIFPLLSEEDMIVVGICEEKKVA